MKKILQNKPVLLLLSAVFIASVLGINQYQFGLWNQFISLPWLYDLVNPALFPNELLVDQRENSPTLFLHLIQSVLPLSGNSIPAVFFALYIIAHFFTLWGFYQLTFTIFKNKKAAVFSVVMLAFAFPVIGDVHLWSSYLMERTLAYPLLIFSLVMLFRKQYIWAVVLQAVAFNIHPLSTVYVMTAAWLGVLVARGFQRQYFGLALLFLILAMPVLYLKFSAPGNLVSSEMQAIWMEVMTLRNAHHAMPSAFPLAIIIKTGFVALAFILLLRFSNLQPTVKKFFIGFSLAIGIMLLVGTVFVEIYPVKSIMQFQFFRSFRFLTLLTFVLFSGLIFTQARPIHFLIAPLLLAQYFYGEPSKTAGALAIIGLAWVVLHFYHISLRSSSILGSAFITLGLAALIIRGGISLDQPEFNHDWKDLQEWVAQNTNHDVIVIVPPQEPGFRVLSKRSTYGDWYDGTKAFFSEEYAQYWLDHMQKLNCTNPDSLKEDYLANSEHDFLRIAAELENKHSKVLVAHYGNSNLDFPVHYRNDSYKLYAVN